ncbi:MAG: glycosyl transferase [Sulfurimonas sp.]|nr:MAG: glycosyl transferase [Sulfurimonas sp.]
MDFFKYIHAVGTGAKGNRDLSYEESKDMMEQILNQSIPNEQAAAFLLGWRLKPETIIEFRASVEACDSFIQNTTVKNSIELGYPFDGKAKNPYIFPLVAKVLKETNLNLVVSGDELTPAKGGITIKDIVSKIDLDSNAFYFDRKEFFPKMSELTDLRMKLGLRTGFNTIEKLPRVANSEYAITGVFHKPYVKKYVDIFSDRYKKFALIQGNEGTPELFSKGRLWIAKGSDIEEFIVDPEYYGINYTKSWDTISIEESLEQLNNPSDEYLKLAKLNAAVYLFVCEKASSIEEAYEKLN